MKTVGPAVDEGIGITIIRSRIYGIGGEVRCARYRRASQWLLAHSFW